MAFEDTWNTAYEGLPADNENINLGAGRIRDLKTNIRERANIDHSWGDADDNGKHLQVTLMAASGVPGTPSGTDGCVFTQVVGSNTELFYLDSEGNQVQLTSTGTVEAFPSGTTLPFYQAGPPAGWTQQNINDVMLRIVNSTGGGSGGSWSISGVTINTSVNTNVNAPSVSTTVNTSVSTSDNGSSVSGTVAGHSLQVSETPSLSVTLPLANSSAAAQGGSGSSVFAVAGSTGFSTSGSGNPHSHSWSGSLSLNLSSSASSSATSTASSPSASSTANSTFSNDASWRPSYINCVLAKKN
jgi:hypothetical protein